MNGEATFHKRKAEHTVKWEPIRRKVQTRYKGHGAIIIKICNCPICFSFLVIKHSVTENFIF